MGAIEKHRTGAIVQTITDNKTGETTYLDKEGRTLEKTVDSDKNGIYELQSIFDHNKGTQINYLYDNDTGSIVSSEEYRYGKLLRRYNYEFYENGKLKSYNKDIGGDGKIEYSADMTYNDNGVLETCNEDSNGDGRTDYVITYTYNEETKHLDETREDIRPLFERIFGGFFAFFG